MRGVTRGCGERVKSGIYAECPTSPNGLPWWEFLVDPPKQIDPAVLGVTPVGVKLVGQLGKDDVWHVLDWIGSQIHYPNVADFVEEVRRFGASRRLPRNLDFSRLSAESQLVLIHSRAYIAHPETFYARLEGLRCPKHREDHADLAPWTEPVPAHPEIAPCCAALWWEDVMPRGDDSFDTDGGRRVRRQMPSFAYEAQMTPAGLDTDRFSAVFMRLPIANLCVIRSDDGGHEPALHAAEQAKLPVNLEDE